MKKEKETIRIDESDFITPKNAITISSISLVIWFITGLTYKMFSVLGVKLPYESYALIVSLTLSVVFSIYIVRKLVRRSDLLMRIIIGVLNTILIYTSANGAQATYSYLSPLEHATVQKGALISFMDARPWIPDKFLKSDNENLVNENKILKDSVSMMSVNLAACRKNNTQLVRQLDSIQGQNKEK